MVQLVEGKTMAWVEVVVADDDGGGYPEGLLENTALAD